MAVLLLTVLLMFSMTDLACCTWCVCKGMNDAVLQKTLDNACGTGADCGPIHQNGSCFLPNNVKAHCSYAVNSFFQRKGQAAGYCDFSGTAVVSATDPSYGGCSYPATLSSAGTSTSLTPTTTTTSPYNTTPSNGLSGTGAGTNLTGPGIDTGDGFRVQTTNTLLFFMILVVSFMFELLE